MHQNWWNPHPCGRPRGHEHALLYYYYYAVEGIRIGTKAKLRHRSFLRPLDAEWDLPKGQEVFCITGKAINWQVLVSSCFSSSRGSLALHTRYISYHDDHLTFSQAHMHMCETSETRESKAISAMKKKSLDEQVRRKKNLHPKKEIPIEVQQECKNIHGGTMYRVRRRKLAWPLLL